MTPGRSPAAGPTLREVLSEATAVLGSVTEARWVLEHATGLDGSGLAAAMGEPADAAVVGRVDTLARRRAAGEPLQYVLGSWPFRRVDLLVDRRALIPRPETESVVDIALGLLAEPGSPRNSSPVVVDLGTGSGAIALSLAVEGPDDAQVWAVDRSGEALALARTNLDRLARRLPDAAGRVRLAQGHWFSALPEELAGAVALVVSNPPYVSAEEWAELDPVVRDHEPRQALVSGDDGLEDVCAIVAQAGRWLAPGAHIVIEIAPHQSGRAQTAAVGAGFRRVRVAPDLTGRARALVGRWPG